MNAITHKKYNIYKSDILKKLYKLKSQIVYKEKNKENHYKKTKEFN